MLLARLSSCLMLIRQQVHRHAGCHEEAADLHALDHTAINILRKQPSVQVSRRRLSSDYYDHLSARCK